MPHQAPFREGKIRGDGKRAKDLQPMLLKNGDNSVQNSSVPAAKQFH